MPTALPLAAGPRLTLRQSARFAWLLLQERHLARRMERVSRRQDRASDGRILHLARRWLACHAAISALLDAPEPEQVAMVRATLSERPR